MAIYVSACQPTIVASAAVREKEVRKTSFIVGALREQRPCQLSRHFPSTLACFFFSERHPYLVLLRPSSEATDDPPSLLVYALSRGGVQ